ncbi:MAG: methylenetetrahydrofolate reductase [Acidilobaceae archaeon]|nr:methylenetetrahydrofolate reductase [Acidilobaceae archaeon]
MELAFEIEPVKRRETLEQRLRRLEGTVEWIDIPDSPMGTTRFSSPLVGCMAKGVSRLGVISHLRVIDVNRIALEAIVKGLSLCGVEALVFLRGDIVDGSSVILDVAPEEAVRITKSMGAPLLAGLTLSLRKSEEEIAQRVKVGADLYLVLHLSEATLYKLEEAVKAAGGAKVYPYVVLLTERNERVLRPILSKAPLYPLEGALALAESLESLTHKPAGLLISSPGDFEGGLRLAELLKRR